MWPLILRALGGAAVAGEGAAIGGAAAGGEAALAGGAARAGAVRGGSLLGESSLSSRVPSVLKNMATNKFVSMGESIRSSNDHETTMDRIADAHTGTSDSPAEAANDDEHAFSGSDHLVTDGRNNHILDMFRGNHGDKAANDNDFPEDESMEASQVTINALTPLLESIDRNTHMTNEKLREISDKIAEWFSQESSIDKLKQSEEKTEVSNRAGNAIDRITDAAAEGGDNEEEKKASLLDRFKNGLLALVGGGAMMGTGMLVDDGGRTPPPGGGYGSSSREGRVGSPRGATVVSSNLTDRENAFVSLISRNEGAGYNTTFGMNANGRSPYTTPEKMFNGRKLTDLTITEVQQYQRALRRETAAVGIGGGRGTSAVGAGQFVGASRGGGTLGNTLRTLGIPQSKWSTTKFTPELQNRMIVQNARNVGIDVNRAETWGPRQLRTLGAQWESLSTAKGKISPGELDRQIREMVRSGVNQGLRDNNARPMGNQVGNGNGALAGPRRANGPPPPSDISIAIGNRIRQLNEQGVRAAPGGNTNVTVNQGATHNTTPAPPRNDRRRPPPAKEESWWKTYFGL